MTLLEKTAFTLNFKTNINENLIKHTRPTNTRGSLIGTAAYAEMDGLLKHVL